LGLLYLSSYLKKKFGNDIEVSIADFRLRGTTNPKEIEITLSEFGPDIIGITSLSVEIKETLELARFIKDKFPDAKLIIGGPLASSEHELLEQFNIFDHIVVGEGEEALSSIVNGDIDASRRILFAHDFREVDMNYIDYPDYNFVNVSDYFHMDSHEAFQIHKAAVPIFTSRGCPFNCSFCLHMFGKKVRFRNIENVIAEITHLVTRYNVRELHIEDDIFNVKKERMILFFNLLKQKNISLKIAFPNGLKYDFLDEEIIRLFKINGVFHVCLGIESVSEKIMDVLSKKHNLKKLTETISLLSKYNILAHGYFITGLPDENIDDLRVSLEYANKSKLHHYSIFKYIPFKKTSLFEKYASILSIADIDRVEGANYHYSNMNFSNINNATLDKLLKKNIYRFYFSPVRIFNTFLAIDTRTLLRKLYIFIYYLFTGKVYFGEKRNYTGWYNPDFTSK